MTSYLFAVTAGLALAPGAAPEGGQHCTVVRYAPDGQRTETVGDPSSYGVSIDRTGSSVSVRSGQGRSAVAASSSSRGGNAVSTSRVRDGARTITIHTDGSGCIVVIDERPDRRRNQ